MATTQPSIFDSAPAPACVAIPSGQVSDGELSRFARLIYARTGIRVSPQKKMLLSNRLRRRLRGTQLTSFTAYYDHLSRLDPSDPEWDAFLQEITTHETYLFRDEHQWTWFRTTFLPGLEVATAAGKPKSLRIWSAACSTGDEPATAACCVAATITSLSQWKVTILGTDIGVGALEQAKAAVFGQRAMRLVPPELQERFFARTKMAGDWQARPILTNMMRFQQHNLIEPLTEKPFDLVFLKNVLIYFDAASKQRAISNVCNAIRPGGLLLSGAAEGIGDLLRGFQRIQPWLHRKPM